MELATVLGRRRALGGAVVADHLGDPQPIAAEEALAPELLDRRCSGCVRQAVTADSSRKKPSATNLPGSAAL